MSDALCRDCFGVFDRPAERCPACASPRIIAHPELHALAIAHIDCDAFYASVEKRDDPSLANKPVIVGGGRRGVVAACCYIARIYGVHSAMPMFKALKLCPQAQVIRPNMEKYRVVGREVRNLMLEVTPLVEPLSVDEAFLDLTGTEKLHGAAPAATLARLMKWVETDIGVTASIGLSYNKFLAKVASERDKPRGFSVIGWAEARDLLSDQPVDLLWGVGKAMRERLRRDGILTVGQLQELPEERLVARYGSMGHHLALFAHGEDDRTVTPNAPAKSVSAETTFEDDVRKTEELAAILWQLSERVSARLKAADIAGRTVTLKLKTADFRLRTRSQRLSAPTQLADVLYRAGLALLANEADGTPFRLIGIAASGLTGAEEADPPDLVDADATRRAQVEHTIDSIRARFGSSSIQKGRGLRRQR